MRERDGATPDEGGSDPVGVGERQRERNEPRPPQRGGRGRGPHGGDDRGGDGGGGRH